VDPEAFRTLVDVNIVGVFNTVRATLQSVIDRRGYMLIVSSAAAFAASPGLAPYDLSKAGVEQFATALRLEVAHLGVDVGSAHMLWIDTPLVQDAKSDLPSFRKMLDSLPGPLGKTTSIEACGKAFVKGIEGRKRYVYCPDYVSLLRWFKPLLSSRIGEAGTLKVVPALLPQMDAEVEALGRSMSARTQEVEK
jgi:NAD(P)-dependent dehydrogenase (short-subunit alcohol dehydrogenase family)